ARGRGARNQSGRAARPRSRANGFLALRAPEGQLRAAGRASGTETGRGEQRQRRPRSIDGLVTTPNSATPNSQVTPNSQQLPTTPNNSQQLPRYLVSALTLRDPNLRTHTTRASLS